MGRVRLVCLAALAITLIAVPDAGAVTPTPPDLTCSYSGSPSNTVTFTVETGEETLLLRRVGDEIKLLSEHVYGTVRRKGKRKKTVWHRIFQPATCNATPTVHNTDAIRVFMDGQEETELDISLEGGSLAPGATPEVDGSPEIEISVEHLTSFHSVGFTGGPENDWFRFGSGSDLAGVNLNAQAESTSADVDATFTPSTDPESDPSLPAGFARMGAGDDVVTDSGGPEFEGSYPVFAAFGGPGSDTLTATNPLFTFMKGGGGDDRIQVGDGKRNVITGGGGRDTIISGAHGNDEVIPGKGHDLAILNGGSDLVAAKDRTKDRILCGGNRDFVSKDRKDRTPGCERKTFAPLHLKPFVD
jgi:hypothetical protein